MQRFWGAGRPEAQIQQQAYPQGEGFKCPKVMQALVCGYVSCKHKNGHTLCAAQAAGSRGRKGSSHGEVSKGSEAGGDTCMFSYTCKAHQLLRGRENLCAPRSAASSCRARGQAEEGLHLLIFGHCQLVQGEEESCAEHVAAKHEGAGAAT